MIRRYFYDQLPLWARPTNPVLRYMLLRDERRQHSWARWLNRLIGLGLVAWLLWSGYQSFRSNLNFGVSGNGESTIFRVLYFPMLLLQMLLIMSALLMTSNMVSNEQVRGTWESVKITSHGAEMAMRSRWAAVFYQMRYLLVALVVVRAVFIAQMLIDLGQYQGYHLDLYLSGIEPQVSLETGIVLLAALMTALMLIPLVLVGLNASIGLVLSTVTRGRAFTVMAQIFILVVEFMLFGATFAGGWAILEGDPGKLSNLTAMERWTSLLLMGSFGDLGLRFMNLSTYLDVWTNIRNGILLGVGILLVVLLQAVLTNGLLWWAAQRASRPGKE